MQAANGGVPFAPGGIAFGPDGNLYTDNTLPGAGADQVIRFGITNSDGQLSYNGSNMTIATGLSVACDITFGANPGDQGNLYVSDDNSVLKITGATTATPTSSLFVSPGSGGLTYSCGLVWQGGNLYDTDPGSGQVLEYDASGNFLGDFTGSALQNPNQQPINTLFLPNGDVVTSTFGPGSGFLVSAQGNEGGALMLFNSSGQLQQNLGAGAFPTTAAGVTNAALAFMTFDTTAPSAESTVVLAQDTVNAAYNQTITPNDGTGSVTLAVSNVQNAIPGLSITGGGMNSLSITGTPTATGTETFTVTATDSAGSTTTTDYTVTVNPAPTLSPATLPADTINVAYANQTISATGGTGAITLAVNVTNAIPGLSITGNGTGSIIISGTPTAAGTETFTVTGTDGAGGTTGPRQYSVVVASLGISPTELQTATVGDKFRVQLTGEGGSGLGYTFRGIGLPSWLTLSASGLLSGTPPVTASASNSFMVTLTDSHKATVTVSYTLNIDPALVLSPTTLTSVTVGQPFSTQLTVAGGSGSGYTLSIGSHPAWLTFSPSGLLSGTPTTAAGSPFRFTVTATDGIGGTGSHTYALTVDPALVIRPVTLPVATAGDPFSQQLTPTGGSGRGYVFTAPGLPSWLTLSPSGLLRGTPPSAVLSPVSIVVTLTDSNGNIINQPYSFTVDSAITVNPTALPPATVGQPLSIQLTATGGSGTGYVFTASGLPAWLRLSRTGLLSGTPPTVKGSPLQFAVTVTDSKSGRSTTTYSLTVS